MPPWVFRELPLVHPSTVSSSHSPASNPPGKTGPKNLPHIRASSAGLGGPRPAPYSPRTIAPCSSPAPSSLPWAKPWPLSPLRSSRCFPAPSCQIPVPECFSSPRVHIKLHSPFSWVENSSNNHVERAVPPTSTSLPLRGSNFISAKKLPPPPISSPKPSRCRRV